MSVELLNYINKEMFKIIITVDELVNNGVVIHVNNREEQEEFFTAVCNVDIHVPADTRIHSYKTHGDKLLHLIQNHNGLYRVMYGTKMSLGKYRVLEYKDISIVK
jgi:hypothetical protein